jgi:exopolysaccharide production protein ExoZ
MAIATPTALPRTLPLLQIFRGAAATFVVLFHVTWHGHSLYPEDFLWRAFLFGHSGVDFFFVLSGFIMVYAHAGDAGRPARAWPFVKARVARIFPAYWVVLAVTLACHVYRPELGDYALNVPTAARALVLYDQLRQPVVPVAWSLSYEIAFYAFFVLYLVAGSALFAAASAAWCALILAANMGWVQVPAPTLLSPLVAEFFLGSLAAMIVLRWRPRFGARALLAAAILWLAVAAGDASGYLDTNQNVRNFAVPYFLLILAAAGYDLRRTRPYPRALLLFGEASYAIFLVHYLGVQNGILWLAGHPAIANTVGSRVTLALLSVALIATGVGFHLGIERPLHSGARRMLHVRSRATRSPAPPVVERPLVRAPLA